MAKIHIVLATYNGAAYLRQQLDSLFRNDWKDFTVEVCDDGSTDGTIGIVQEYMGKYQNITLHQNEKNLGYVMNFMQGIQRSTAPYIMLCDQDDIWHADKIRKTYEKMKDLEREMSSAVPLLVYSDAMNFDSETGEEQGSFYKNSHLNTKHVDPPHLLMENKCIGCTIMVNGTIRQYLQELPAEIRVHDWWLALICSHFGEIAYLDERTLQYRQHSGNMIGGSGFSEYVGNRIRNIRKQQEVIRATYAQGQAFYNVFSDRLQGEKKEITAKFASMGDSGIFRRKWRLIRYGFWKSGALRNLALFFLV